MGLVRKSALSGYSQYLLDRQLLVLNICYVLEFFWRWLGSNCQQSEFDKSFEKHGPNPIPIVLLT